MPGGIASRSRTAAIPLTSRYVCLRDILDLVEVFEQCFSQFRTRDEVESPATPQSLDSRRIGVEGQVIHQEYQIVNEQYRILDLRPVHGDGLQALPGFKAIFKAAEAAT